MFANGTRVIALTPAKIGRSSRVTRTEGVVTSTTPVARGGYLYTVALDNGTTATIPCGLVRTV